MGGYHIVCHNRGLVVKRPRPLRCMFIIRNIRLILIPLDVYWCRKSETDQTRPKLEGVLNDGHVTHMRYKLPDISCDHAVLQMAYRECYAGRC